MPIRTVTPTAVARLVLAAGTLTAPAIAQDAEPTAQPNVLDRTAFVFNATAGYTGSADLDVGDVSIARLDTSLSTQTRLNDTNALSLRFGSEFSFYDFADTGPFGVGGGMDTGARYDAGLVFSSQVDETWGYFIGGSVTASPGEGASWDDSVTAGGFGGFSYQVNDSLRLGAGIGVSSRLEDDVRVIPVPTIEWQINEQWNLHTANRALNIRGLELSYDANDWLTLFALGGWASREYRLDDDSGPSPDGVLRDERVPLYLGATMKASEKITIDFGVGGSVWSQFELLDASGNEIADSDADPALGGWIGATIRF